MGLRILFVPIGRLPKIPLLLKKKKERDPNKIYTHQHGAMVETERNITSNKKR